MSVVIGFSVLGRFHLSSLDTFLDITIASAEILRPNFLMDITILLSTHGAILPTTD